MHNEDDWGPYSLEGRTEYPSTEEAEYPAALVFTLAVACTFWAANQGYAIIEIPRLPPLNAQVIAGIGRPGRPPPFGRMPWSRWPFH